MDKLSITREFFETMITYRTTSIISALTRLQILLLSNKGKLTPEEMDAEINRLEEIRCLLTKEISSVAKSSKGPCSLPSSAEAERCKNCVDDQSKD